MEPKEIQQPSVSECRRTARELLSQNANRLLLVEAILITLLCLPLHLMIDNILHAVLMPSLWASFSGVAWLIAVLIKSLAALFITLPAFIGLLRLAGRMAFGASVVLADLFEPFSAASAYRRSLGLSWAILWRLLMIVAAVRLTCTVAVLLPIPSVLVVFAVIAEITVGVLLYLRNFSLAAVLLFSRMPARRARQLSARISAAARGTGICFVLSFLPRLLLGLLTLGILLLWDTLPEMLTSYFDYQKKIYETIIQSEE